MAITYTTTAAHTVKQGVKVAIYGNAGAGKTSVLATAPAPFIVACEPGLLSLSRKNIERMYGVGTPGISYDIPAANIQNCADARGVHAAFAAGEEWTKAFKTLCLDSVSQLAEGELAFQMTQTPNGQKAYGQMADEILEVIRLFNALPNHHVVFTAKQSVASHSGLFSASFPGQLLDFHFPYEFDEVLQLCTGEAGEDGKVPRYFRTVSDYKNFAKDRSGALDVRGEAAFLYNIFSKISAA